MKEAPIKRKAGLPEDPRENNLGYWSAGAAERFPERSAIIDLSREPPRHISYRELEERLDRFASLVTARGMRAGDRIAMAVGNRFEFVEIMYGAMRAGVVPVPLNTKLGADALRYIIKDAGAVAAVVEPSVNRFIADVVETLRLRTDSRSSPHLRDGTFTRARSWTPPAHSSRRSWTRTTRRSSPTRPARRESPKVSSSRTGGQLWWIRCLEKYWPEKSGARALAAVPLYHKNAMAGAIKPLLHVGGTVVLLPDFEPRRFLETLAQYRCTQVGAVPAVFAKLLQETDLIASLDFGALETISIGSAPVQKELMLAVQDAFGAKVGESYGLTEGGPVMIGPPVDGRAVPFGSCGVVWPEGEVKLVSADGEESSEQGELWVRNPGVTPGYHNLPDVNAKRILDGWLATGDLFRCDPDGFFYFLGRTDDMFNCGGENVYPKEVEDLLMSHDDVLDAAVVPVPHAVKGHVPVAMVMCRTSDGSAAVVEETLKEYCLANGPAYAHPRRVLSVDAMPLNGAGKVDRARIERELRERLGPAIAEGGKSR